MQFNTFGFLVFFAVVFCVYYLTSQGWRWIVLLVSSLVFYAALKAPHLLIALTLVTIISYVDGRKLAAFPPASRQRKSFLWLGVFLNLAVLVIVRYLRDLPNTLPGLTDSIPGLTVSVGVSFYVFQAISYLVDIYNGKQVAEDHFGYFALYISFFPKLLQGPIERASKLLPQLRNPQPLTDQTIRSALLLFAWGLFKKMVIAHWMGIFVGEVYNHLPSYVGVPLWLATFYYALEIYCDFSGYTDMAIGLARLLGINLSINFNKPYLAVSIADFWRRWHISFSTWIFDYIFKPVQRFIGSYRGINLRERLFSRETAIPGEPVPVPPRPLKNVAAPAALLVTFFLSGLWHGINWGFVIWGLLHGLYMAVYALISPYEKQFLLRFNLEKSLPVRIIRTGFTFLLVCFAWIFFRANTLADAWYIVSHLFSDLNAAPGNYLLVAFGIPLAFIGILVLAIVELPDSLPTTHLGQAFNRFVAFRWFIYWLLAMSILGLGELVSTGFDYFRF